MANIETKESARILQPFEPPVVGGTDGVASPKRKVNGPNGTNGTHGANGANGKVPHPPRGFITRREQLRRAFTIIKLSFWFIAKSRWDRWFTKDIDQTIKNEAVHLRQIAERLGGTFIKLAQQASIRRDVLPEAYCNELASLQDRVPPMPIELMRRILEEQIRRPVGEVFSYIDPSPIGSASIGCVYRATRIDGREVAIKVRRPEIEKAFALDLAVMDRWVEFVVLFGFSSMGLSKNMVDELRHVLAEELNYALEMRYQGLFRRNFKKWKRVNITAPRVHRDLSGPNVIVADFVDGIRLKDLLSSLQVGGEGYAQ
ncbi:MAG TPA: AarF/UbiB family protein, partial [Vicinamibacterales bacterium]